MQEHKEAGKLKRVEQAITALSPRSLYARFLLISLLPLIIIQIISAYIFYERHWASLSRNMTASLTGEVATIINSIDNLPADMRDSFIRKNMRYNNISVSIDADTELSTYKNKNRSYPDIISNLRTKIDNKFAIFHDPRDMLRISAQVSSDVVNISFSDKKIENPSTYIFMLWMVGSSILLMIISTIFLKNQVRSIIYLSKAAENFGKGNDTRDFKPSGASEIRAAGIAFIEMKERIKRLMDNRTQMLAGVSHDLKTPLTRMKLMAAFIDNKTRKDEIEHEIDDMTKMIEGYLSFAQLDSKEKFPEKIERINLKDFINELVARYQIFSKKITVNIADDIYLNIRPEYFRRSVSNLIDNSVKYAKNNIYIEASVNAEGAVIHIDDDGNGIPENKMDLVFQPFYRLDESRNSETGGVGLGLSITRDIINKHGGNITLSKSATLGGLRATIILPK